MNVEKMVFCAFIDLSKTYDKGYRDVLEEYEVEEWLANAVKAVYAESKACIRLNVKQLV